MSLQSRPVLSCGRRAGVGELTEIANSKLIGSGDFDTDPCHMVLRKPRSLSITAGICPLPALSSDDPFEDPYPTPQQPSICPTPL